MAVVVDQIRQRGVSQPAQVLTLVFTHQPRVFAQVRAPLELNSIVSYLKNGAEKQAAVEAIAMEFATMKSLGVGFGALDPIVAAYQASCSLALQYEFYTDQATVYDIYKKERAQVDDPVSAFLAAFGEEGPDAGNMPGTYGALKSAYATADLESKTHMSFQRYYLRSFLERRWFEDQLLASEDELDGMYHRGLDALQGAFGHLTITLVDPGGSPVSKADVTLVYEENGFTADGKSVNPGKYAFDNVARGVSIRIKAKAPSFKDTRSKPFVMKNAEMRGKIVLQPEGAGEGEATPTPNATPEGPAQ